MYIQTYNKLSFSSILSQICVVTLFWFFPDEQAHTSEASGHRKPRG